MFLQKAFQQLIALFTLVILFVGPFFRECSTTMEGKAMNKEKKGRLFILPLIIIILVFIPGMIEIAPHDFIQGMPDKLWNLFLVIEMTALIIWAILFYNIPLGVYIVMLVVYTGLSWKWILNQKKGNAVYAIVWLVLCVLSILMYWKIGPLYHVIINM